MTTRASDLLAARRVLFALTGARGSRQQEEHQRRS